MEIFRDRKKGSNIEAVSWVCATVQDDHDWVFQYSLVMHEHEILGELGYDLEVPCVVPWGLLWYSAPTSLNNVPVTEWVNDRHIQQRY